MNKEYIEDFYNRVNESPEHDVYSLYLPMLLITKQIYQESECIYKEKYDLLHSEVDVLAALYFNNTEHTLSPTELYSATIFSSGGMTKVLKKLEDRALIKRFSSKEDKRKVMVSLTKKGAEMILSCVENTSKRLEAIFNNLDETEKIFLKGSLKKLLYSYF